MSQTALFIPDVKKNNLAGKDSVETELRMIPPSIPPSLLLVGPSKQINSAQHIIDLRLIPFTGIKTDT